MLILSSVHFLQGFRDAILDLRDLLVAAAGATSLYSRNVEQTFDPTFVSWPGPQTMTSASATAAQAPTLSVSSSSITSSLTLPFILTAPR